MKTIILAAGEGTRLRPYTLDRPKCLVEVDGRSLLDRHIDVLRSKNMAPIILVGGYLSTMLNRPGVILRLNPRYAETNMVWTLFCTEEDLSGGAIVAYGDIVYSRRILEALLASAADIAVAIDLDWESYWRARNENPLLDAETLKLASDGRILELGKKPQSMAEIEGQYMGLIKFSAAGADILCSVFRQAKADGMLGGRAIEKAYMTDLIQAVIDNGHRVDSVQVCGEWVEVDSVSDLKLPITAERLRKIAA
jgi:choline kinase